MPTRTLCLLFILFGSTDCLLPDARVRVEQTPAPAPTTPRREDDTDAGPASSDVGAPVAGASPVSGAGNGGTSESPAGSTGSQPCPATCPGACVDGECKQAECSEDFGDCDRDGLSCETDLTSTLAHCGSCEHACQPASVAHTIFGCIASACKVIECATGYGDCDGDYRNGCEEPLNTSKHCGRCETACEYANALSACVSGQCQRMACDANYADCDRDGKDCEVSLTTRETCGSCETLCRLPNAVGACSRAESGGAVRCDVEACNAGWGNCDGISGNGCERDTRSLAVGGQGPCVPALGCIGYTYQSHEYYVCPLPMAWADARRTCQAQLRGDLATVDSAEVAAFLEARVATRTWVGHNDQRVPGLWVWASNGAPYWKGDSNGVKIADRYANWEVGEPNGSGQCGSLLNTGTIADDNCNDVKPFVCEVRPDSCPNDPAKLDPGQCGCGAADTDATGDGVAECL